MASLDDALAYLVDAAGTRTIKAAPLDTTDQHPLRKSGHTPLLVSWCVCVTDPCPCDCQDGPIIWVPSASVRKRTATTGKNRRGDAVYEFQIERDAAVVVESFRQTTMARISAPRKPAQSTGKVPPPPVLLRSPGSSYSGQECGGGTLFDVWTESDGAGGTTFHYIAVGSCAQ